MVLSKNIVFRLEEEDYNKLFLLAEKEKTTVSNLLRFLVYKAIESPKIEPVKPKKPKKPTFHAISI